MGLTSRPARGGWIEITCSKCGNSYSESRPARGGWIEIVKAGGEGSSSPRPAPHGAGGLKLSNVALQIPYDVPPRTGRVD